jgi:hypothetical protein
MSFILPQNSVLRRLLERRRANSCQPGSVFRHTILEALKLVPRPSLRFRTETFNAFHTPHFHPPDAEVGVLNSGSIASGGACHAMRAGMKMLSHLIHANPNVQSTGHCIAGQYLEGYARMNIPPLLKDGY